MSCIFLLDHQDSVLKIERCDMSCLQVRVQLDMDVIPLMDGALECSGSGVASSLFPSNLKAAALVDNAEQAAELSSWPLQFDPQTSRRPPCRARPFPLSIQLTKVACCCSRSRTVGITPTSDMKVEGIWAALVTADVSTCICVQLRPCDRILSGLCWTQGGF